MLQNQEQTLRTTAVYIVLFLYLGPGEGPQGRKNAEAGARGAGVAGSQPLHQEGRPQEKPTKTWPSMKGCDMI